MQSYNIDEKADVGTGVPGLVYPVNPINTLYINQQLTFDLVYQEQKAHIVNMVYWDFIKVTMESFVNGNVLVNTAFQAINNLSRQELFEQVYSYYARLLFNVPSVGQDLEQYIKVDHVTISRATRMGINGIKKTRLPQMVKWMTITQFPINYEPQGSTYLDQVTIPSVATKYIRSSTSMLREAQVTTAGGEVVFVQTLRNTFRQNLDKNQEQYSQISSYYRGTLNISSKQITLMTSPVGFDQRFGDGSHYYVSQLYQWVNIWLNVCNFKVKNSLALYENGLEQIFVESDNQGWTQEVKAPSQEWFRQIQVCWVSQQQLEQLNFSIPAQFASYQSLQNYYNKGQVCVLGTPSTLALDDWFVANTSGPVSHVEYQLEKWVESNAIAEGGQVSVSVDDSDYPFTYMSNFSKIRTEQIFPQIIFIFNGVVGNYTYRGQQLLQWDLFAAIQPTFQDLSLHDKLTFNNFSTNDLTRLSSIYRDGRAQIDALNIVMKMGAESVQPQFIDTYRLPENWININTDININHLSMSQTPAPGEVPVNKLSLFLKRGYYAPDIFMYVPAGDVNNGGIPPTHVFSIPHMDMFTQNFERWGFLDIKFQTAPQYSQEMTIVDNLISQNMVFCQIYEMMKLEYLAFNSISYSDLFFNQREGVVTDTQFINKLQLIWLQSSDDQFVGAALDTFAPYQTSIIINSEFQYDYNIFSNAEVLVLESNDYRWSIFLMHRFPYTVITSLFLSKYNAFDSLVRFEIAKNLVIDNYNQYIKVNPDNSEYLSVRIPGDTIYQTMTNRDYMFLQNLNLVTLPEIVFGATLKIVAQKAISTLDANLNLGVDQVTLYIPTSIMYATSKQFNTNTNRTGGFRSTTLAIRRSVWNSEFVVMPLAITFPTQYSKVDCQVNRNQFDLNAMLVYLKQGPSVNVVLKWQEGNLPWSPVNISTIQNADYNVVNQSNIPSLQRMKSSTVQQRLGQQVVQFGGQQQSLQNNKYAGNLDLQTRNRTSTLVDMRRDMEKEVIEDMQQASKKFMGGMNNRNLLTNFEEKTGLKVQPSVMFDNYKRDHGDRESIKQYNQNQVHKQQKKEDKKSGEAGRFSATQVAKDMVKMGKNQRQILATIESTFGQELTDKMRDDVNKVLGISGEQAKEQVQVQPVTQTEVEEDVIVENKAVNDIEQLQNNNNNNINNIIQQNEYIQQQDIQNNYELLPIQSLIHQAQIIQQEQIENRIVLLRQLQTSFNESGFNVEQLQWNQQQGYDEEINQIYQFEQYILAKYKIQWDQVYKFSYKMRSLQLYQYEIFLTDVLNYKIDTSDMQQFIDIIELFQYVCLSRNYNNMEKLIYVDFHKVSNLENISINKQKMNNRIGLCQWQYQVFVNMQDQLSYVVQMQVINNIFASICFKIKPNEHIDKIADIQVVSLIQNLHYQLQQLHGQISIADYQKQIKQFLKPQHYQLPLSEVIWNMEYIGNFMKGQLQDIKQEVKDWVSYKDFLQQDGNIQKQNAIQQIITLVIQQNFDIEYGSIEQIGLFDKNKFFSQGKVRGDQQSKTEYFLQQSEDIQQMMYNYKDQQIISYPFVKNEVMKLRGVINTDIQTHIYLSCVYTIMQRNKKTDKIYNSMSLKKRLMVMKQKAYKCRQVISLDYSKFDQQSSWFIIKQILRSFALYQNLPTLTLIVELFISKQEDSLVQIDVNEFIKYQGGVLSGWRITSILQSLINLVILSIALIQQHSGITWYEQDKSVIMQTFQYVWDKHDAIVQGDDTVLFINYPHFQIDQFMSVMVNEMLIKIKPEQQFHHIVGQYSQVIFEFLRNKYIIFQNPTIAEGKRLLCLSYPLRIIPKLLYKHPTRFNMTQVQVVASKIQSIQQILIRSQSQAMVINLIINIISQLFRIQNLQSIDLIMSQQCRKGLGLITSKTNNQLVLSFQLSEVIQDEQNYIQVNLEKLINNEAQIYSQLSVQVDDRKYITARKQSQLIIDSIMLQSIQKQKQIEQKMQSIDNNKSLFKLYSQKYGRNYVTLLLKELHSLDINNFHSNKFQTLQIINPSITRQVVNLLRNKSKTPMEILNVIRFLLGYQPIEMKIDWQQLYEQLGLDTISVPNYPYNPVQLQSIKNQIIMNVKNNYYKDNIFVTGEKNKQSKWFMGSLLLDQIIAQMYEATTQMEKDIFYSTNV